METNGEEQHLNERPIIGVMDQVTPTYLHENGKTYIPATYVKFIESAGARVVPVFVDQSYDYYEHMFNSINGILWPGGSQSNFLESNYAKTGKIFYDLAVKSNQEGDYFPIWGACQGFELMACLAAGQNILSRLEAVNTNLNLTLNPDYPKSKILAGASDKILHALQTKEVTYNFHRQSVTPTNYNNCATLKSAFNVVSTSENGDGEEFISMIEGKDYPFYGVQFHPEKPLFAWKVTTRVKHDPVTIAASRYFADFFVSEARLNKHSFASYQMERDALIFNYRLEHLEEGKLDQAYFFNIY